MKPTGIQGVLPTIKVLFRAPDTLGLYGIPYEMRPLQQPGDLWRSPLNGRRPGPWPYWICLGWPGWWGEITNEDQQAITSWLAQHQDRVPQGPNEWTRIARQEGK